MNADVRITNAAPANNICTKLTCTTKKYDRSHRTKHITFQVEDKLLVSHLEQCQLNV